LLLYRANIEQGLIDTNNKGFGLQNSRTVRYVLIIQTYTGDLEQGAENTLIPNTHKVSIYYETFNAVQALLIGRSGIMGLGITL